MNSWEKFGEIKLPDKEDFYSQLYEENITDKDYARANIVWKHFNIQNLGDYHDLYLMTDVYLLTDVFDFRDIGSALNKRSVHDDAVLFTSTSSCRRFSRT